MPPKFDPTAISYVYIRATGGEVRSPPRRRPRAAHALRRPRPGGGLPALLIARAALPDGSGKGGPGARAARIPAIPARPPSPPPALPHPAGWARGAGGERRGWG